MSSFGLMGFKSVTQLQEEADAERERSEAQRKQAVETSLSAQIRRHFETARNAKRDIERRLVDCARRQKGQYSPDKLALIRETGGSEVYPKITTTKCRAAAAWISDVLMPANGKPTFGLEPTPVSDIPPEYLQAFMQRMQQEMPDVDEERAVEMLRSKVEEVARKAAERHEDVIADQMTEGGWHRALEEFIEDFATFPTAVMRGPTLMMVPEIQWQEGWNMIETEAIKPTWKRVSPFDIYPSPDSTDCDDGQYLIEREPYSRATLSRLRGVPGFSSEAIEEVLREHGDGGLREWLAVDSERADIEGRNDDLYSARADTIEALHYWGSAQGLKLLQWGMNPADVPDPLEEYEIDAVLIGRHVIRAVINRNPMGHRPYNTASFQNVPGSFWGIAIPELMEDIQDMCCAVARAQANNTAFASGPQIDVNVERLAPEENPNEIYPMKRWRTKSDRNSQSAQAPAVRFYQPPSQAGELMTVYDNWEKRADDATNIPRYAYGNENVGGAGSTMGGLAMLMESANKGIKAAIRHIDRGVISRSVAALWLFNMRYSPDNSIKGDCTVVPRGASAMLLKEQTQQARGQFLAQTANPLDMEIIGVSGRAKLLRTVAEELDMPDLIPSIEDLEARQAQQSEDQAKQQAAIEDRENAKIQGELQVKQAKVQYDALNAETNAKKADADIQAKTADAAKTQAETQEILLEIRNLMRQLNGQPNPGRVSGD